MAVEYAYWNFVESHPGHRPASRRDQEDALEFLAWCFTDTLFAPNGKPASVPFTREECKELLDLFRSIEPIIGGRATMLKTRIVAKILLRNLQWRQQLYSASKSQTPLISGAQDVGTLSGFPMPPVSAADERDVGANEGEDVGRGRPNSGTSRTLPVPPQAGFVKGSINLVATLFLTATRVFLWLPSKGLQAVSSAARASGVASVAYSASHLAMDVLGIKDPNHPKPSAVNRRSSADRLPPGESEDDEARSHLLKTHRRSDSVSYSLALFTHPDPRQSGSQTLISPSYAIAGSFQLVLVIWTLIAIFTVACVLGLLRSLGHVWKDEVYIPRMRGMIHSGAIHRHVKQPQWGA
ncbi:uncharacterized protein EI90DRAFT_2468693 [Cantharellus anzutake]|uniref:uncharacterized protein n=1 Tax=Cantharellus anzutake TaxID=1750568 RepID=UPI001908AA4E|nr:uncharacterized protein EI90DRAFT_2468693 [Cantharellus anzutake]KAF8339188.1 hypothetical protein EI90DRAFT_2468693 [Cantharellus anzutake]